MFRKACLTFTLTCYDTDRGMHAMILPVLPHSAGSMTPLPQLRRGALSCRQCLSYDDTPQNSEVMIRLLAGLRVDLQPSVAAVCRMFAELCHHCCQVSRAMIRGVIESFPGVLLELQVWSFKRVFEWVGTSTPLRVKTRLNTINVGKQVVEDSR